jgi:hypothetical protein
MNCQSIRTKRSELLECVEYTKPDAIIGCESWLSKEHKNAEIFPDGTIKMSCNSDLLVLILWQFIINILKFWSFFWIPLTDFDRLDMDSLLMVVLSELQWAEIQAKNKSVIIGSYYRPPNSNLDAFNNLKSSIANVSEHSKDKPIILETFLLYHLGKFQHFYVL